MKHRVTVDRLTCSLLITICGTAHGNDAFAQRRGERQTGDTAKNVRIITVPLGERAMTTLNRGVRGVASHMFMDTPVKSGAMILNGNFSDGLNGWTTSVVAGDTAPGQIVAENEQAVFREGDSFLVTLQQTFILQKTDVPLSFDVMFVPGFDQTDDFMPDAFEVHLLADNSQSVVPTWDPLASSFFNVQEDLTTNLADGVSFDGQIVSVDVSSVLVGTQVTVFFDLIGADADTAGEVRIDNVSLEKDCDRNGVPDQLELFHGCACDNRIDLAESAGLVSCLAGPDIAVATLCRCFDTDGDNDVDIADFGRLQNAFNAGCGDDICRDVETCGSCAKDCGCDDGDNCTDDACDATDVCVFVDNGTCPECIGIAFTLNIDDLNGTAGDDDFCAPLVFESGAGRAVASLQTGDRADGGPGGIDMLVARFNATTETMVVPASLVNIELLTLTDIGSATSTLSAINIPDVTHVTSLDSIQTVVVVDLPRSINAEIINSISSMTISYVDLAVLGVGDQMVLTLSNVQDGIFTINTDTTNGMESLVIVSLDVANTLFQVTQNMGRLEQVLIQGAQGLRIDTPFDASVTEINATAATGDVKVGLGAAGLILGGSGNDVFFGSSGIDLISSGMGDDQVHPGLGQDLVNVGSGADIVDLENLTAGDFFVHNSVRVTGMTINGSGFIPGNDVDAFRFGDVTTDGDLSDGASVAEIQTVDTPGDQSMNGVAGVLELSWEFTSGVFLDENFGVGTTLLTGLGSLTGSVGGTITVNDVGDRILIVAYQQGAAFILHGDAGADDILTGQEIKLIAIVDGGVAVGGFVPSNFQ